MTIIDISVPIDGALPVYPGDPSVEIDLWAQLSNGDLADLTRLSMGVHSGTHVDAPSHFMRGGATLDALDLSACIGAAEVIDLTDLGFQPIGAQVLAERMSTECKRVLLKSQNSLLWNQPFPAPAFASLSAEAARFLVQREVVLVGIDYLSVAPVEDPATVHRELLSAGIVILEGLNLRAVAAGTYTLICPPLRIRGAEGAPARAVLVTDAATLM